KGKRVLDLGCNAGFWSLNAIEAGADFVLGVDGRQMHVDQANFVFDVKGIDKSRYHFAQGNLYEFDFWPWAPFDIVFGFGLMYHIEEPMGRSELISRSKTDILFNDPGMIRLPGSFVSYRRESSNDPRATM